MPLFTSLTKHSRPRFLAGLRRSRRRVAARSSAGHAAATESLEDRALLSAVTYSAATQSAIFNADAAHENVVSIFAPNADTIIIRSQRLDSGVTVDDPITLQGDAAANPGFTLDGTGSVLTIDVTTAGSIVADMAINTFEEADRVEVFSTAAATRIQINGGTGDDSVEVGSSFLMDSIFGDLTVEGGPGNDDLSLLDFNSLQSDVINFTDTMITGIAAGDITYGSTESVFVDTADIQPVTFNILSTATGVASSADLTFDDGSGPVQATVTLGNTNALFNGTPSDMNDILGDFQLITNSGSLLLQVDDSADASGGPVSITETTIDGFSPGTVSFTPGTEFVLLDVLTGDGNDDVDLSTSPTGVQIDTRGGNDVIVGSSGDDILLAGAGDDTVSGGGGDDFIDGDVDNDDLSGGDGDDLILGFSGNDVIDGDAGNDELLGEEGNDTISGGDGNDIVEGGDGLDVISGGEGADFLQGGPQDDLINGDDGNDVLSGGLGNDSLFGDRGSDTLAGDFGDDLIRGGNGPDVIAWLINDGSDDVDGGGAVDQQVVIGGAADETFDVSGQAGAGVIQIGTATVTTTTVEEIQVIAAAGDDLITIGDLSGTAVTRVSVRGDDGNDRVEGQAMAGARGEFIGGRGDDVLFGGSEDDTLKGGVGRDSIVGGPGDDSVKGSGGADDFVWNSGDGSDIVDAGSGPDVLTVNANGSDDSFVITTSPDGTLLTKTSPTVATVTMNGVENLSLNTDSGDDTVLVGDLSSSDLESINADLAEGHDTFDASGMMLPIPLDLLGGLGRDSLSGGPGDDFLRGAVGKDTLLGGGGQDELIGDEGDDSISGGDGNDLIDGGAGNDILRGKSGSDILLGGGGNDRIEGGSGDDFISGSSGHDRIAGGAGDDLIEAGLGSDDVTGGDGRDFLIGGLGSDELFGNSGQDLLVAGDVNLSDAALHSIHGRWTTEADYTGRVRLITNTRVRPDGKRVVDDASATDTFLLPITSDRTVLDDEANDVLNGGSARDLFFADFDDDAINGRVANETHIDER